MSKNLHELEGPALSAALGEVFNGEANRCYNGRDCQCGKPHCTPPDPIPRTWPEAMKWRDWAVEKYHLIAFRFAIVEVKNQTLYAGMKLDIWLACKAQPEHYLKAAALCKENDNGNIK